MPSLTPTQVDKINGIVRHYGRYAAKMAAEPFQIYEKGVKDYVTTVDRWLDRQLTQEFTALFPHDGCITEENMESRQAFRSHYDRLWLIDPLDGTEDFIKGSPHYAVMVGLLHHHRPEAGWVYAPAVDRLYFTGAEGGVFQTTGDRPPFFVVGHEPPPPSPYYCPLLIGYPDHSRFGQAIRQRIPEVQFKFLGGFGLKVLEVVVGRAGLYLYLNGRVKLWDTVGPIALAQAAGLVCCDLEGRPLQFTPQTVDPDTLAHRQPIIVGWESYVLALRSRLQEAVALSGA